jgi:hypothetical protein
VELAKDTPQAEKLSSSGLNSRWNTPGLWELPLLLKFGKERSWQLRWVYLFLRAGAARNTPLAAQFFLIDFIITHPPVNV